MRTFRYLVLCAALLGIAQIFFAQSNAAFNVDEAVLRRAGTTGDPNPGTWLTYGHSQTEQRFSTLKGINDTNAGRLGLEFTYVIGAGGGNQEGTPLMWNNTLYGITTWSVVYAIDAKTGAQKWRWDPEINQQAVRPRICCGVVNRGLALYKGKIIAALNDGRLQALDAMTGKPVWESRMVYPQDLYTLTMAPRIAGNKVVVGASGGDRPTRGLFAAFDAETGKHAWTFYTVPGDPALPPENDAMREALKTWGGDFYKKGGGGAVWDGLAYDAELNLVYVGTGNAEPWVQKFRGVQGVDNLYTCSILAVDADTGQLKWYFQTTPNDNWDFDNVQQLMILDLNINGRPRKVITQAAKNGFFYVLDRATGEFIHGSPFVKVNWAKGLDDKGRPMVNPEAYYDLDPVEIYPSGGGAHNWAPMSFNPNTGLVYIPATYSPFVYAATAELREGTTGYSRGKGEPRKIKEPSIGPEAPDGVRGGLQAWDPVNRKLAWRANGGGGIGGGTVTTAGNLVFQVVNDGTFAVYTADKGTKLYEINVGRTGMAPPITYEVDGKQYVAFQGGLGRPAQTNGPNDEKIDGPPMLYVFAVDGKAAMPPPVVAPAKNAGPPPAPPKNAAPELQQQ